jgi:hypothetical protein
MTWVMSNLISVHLEELLVLVQYRCTTCAKTMIGSGWTHRIVLLSDKAQVEARFSLFVDSANLDTR